MKLVLDSEIGARLNEPSQIYPRPFADMDVLVNNAGLALGLEPAPRADLDEWQTVIDTNCSGLVYLTRASLPGMITRGPPGHILNLGSVAVTYPYRGGNVYGATKAPHATP